MLEGLQNTEKDSETEVAEESVNTSGDRYLYDVNKGVRGRDGGPYYDDIEREAAELRRAKVEGREPDVDNAPATVGTVLVLPEQLDDNVYANPSMATAPGPGAAILATKDDPEFLASPVTKVPAENLEEDTENDGPDEVNPSTPSVSA